MEEQRVFIFSNLYQIRKGLFSNAVRKDPNGDDLLRADVYPSEKFFTMAWDMREGFTYDDFFAGINRYYKTVMGSEEFRGSVLLPKIDAVGDFEGPLKREDFEGEGINLEEHEFMRVESDHGNFTYELTDRYLSFFESLRAQNPTVLIEAASTFASTSGIDLPAEAVTDLLHRVIFSAESTEN